MAKVSKLRHFRLAPHQHTGKLIHHRHTSHVALLILLAIIGPLVFAFQDVTQALPPPVDSDVYISATVSGPPPSSGATITSPVTGTQIPYQSTVQVSGTCAIDTFVVVSSNNSVVGSTACTPTGTFALDVQLQPGKNVLTAKNYDALNQAGPDTPSVTIFLSLPSGESPGPQITNPAIPSNPYVGGGDRTACDDYKVPELPTSGKPHVSIVCIPRVVEPNVEYKMGILVWGGTAPYALDIDWGDKSEHGLISLAKAGYTKVSFKYAHSGTYTITIRLKDANQNSAYVQTAVQVNGQKQSFLGGIQNTISRIQWFETPVPVYFLAVALTLGFWGGDLFDRRFGISKHYQRRKSA